MKFLINAIRALKEFTALDQAVKSKELPAAVTGLSSIHKAHMIYSLCALNKRRAFVAASEEAEAQRLHDDLSIMGMHPALYPLRDFNFRDTQGSSHEYEHQRLHALSRYLTGSCDCIIFCMDAALQHTLPPEELARRTVTLRVAQTISPQDVVNILLACGYVRADQIEGTGQYALRGGILDFFTPDAENPVRVEFWGDEIDTISFFDRETQRRTVNIPEITIAPSVEALIEHPEELEQKIRKHASSLRGKSAAAAKEVLNAEADKLSAGVQLGCADKYLPFLYEKTATVFDYADENTLLFVSEPVKGKERIRTTQWQWGEDLKDYLSHGILCKGLDTYSADWQYALEHFSSFGAIYLDAFARGSYETPIKTLQNVNARQSSVWSGSMQLLTEDVQSMMHSNWCCVVLAGSQRAAQTTAADLQAQGVNAVYVAEPEQLHPGQVLVTEGGLSAGLEYPSAAFGLITHGRLLSQRKSKQKKRAKNSQEIYSLAELSPGDYVVHSSHGIGVFEGIHKISMQGVVKDYMKLRYAKSDTLYVPVTQLDLVSKYIGPREDSQVRLHRLGGADWQKTKARVRSAVKDMAKELIQLYAQRMNAKGHAFCEDTEWQRDFESHFEFEETEDQLRCIEEIKADMERESPMDRLLCGDVGFGKTEVALRAAFKCISDSKQCAMLVPTTILAWQHYQTILKRMEGFPIKVELLSRFRTPKQQEEILNRLRRGEVDFVVGTHRLVSKDVRFRDLGLVIIDEEQRFGVAQKEKLKDLCKNVDVVTLSATPIPRTLNMALSGIRDMSVIEEAPHDRHPVQTYVLEHDNGILADAIHRELRRGGQVYYLHNDIGTIDRVSATLQSLVPHARIGIGHGKMNENELSEVWRKLVDQEIDVLVCTTIIETGVDVPNANTLIIDNADRMGLSQLHQLRGRVGRSSRRAYAYLTFTRNKVLSEIAQKRLSAIREFTEFGSGFKIAMRDLEIRGAGNILGGEQHGHMEAVGYDLYLKLLAEAVSQEKGEAPPPGECLVDLQIQAHIPEPYIENLSQRLEIYRRIADIRNDEDASDVLDELIDRFGDPPAAVRGLIDVALLRNMAAGLGIYEVKQQGETLLLYVDHVDMKRISAMISQMRSRVMLSAGSKPYISVRAEKGASPLETLGQALRAMQDTED